MPRVKPVVFISSTALDLRDHREAAAKAARQAGFDVEMMEDFEARGDHSPYVGDMKKVGECDVMVALVAKRYGWVPPDQPEPETAKSITWLECEAARREEKELLVFVLEDGHPWPAEREEAYRAMEAVTAGKLTPELTAEIQRNLGKLGEFKEWLRTLGIRKPFTTPDSVNSLVQESLHKWKLRHPEALTTGPAKKDNPAEYLRLLREQTEWIDIRGLQVGSGKAYRFRIRDLYIPLTTGSSVTASTLLEEALQQRLVLIEGDPGSGKTTFLRRIAWDLCSDTPTLKRPQRGFPIYLRIGDLEQHIDHCRKAHRADAPTLDHAADWLAHFLAAAHPSLDQAYFEQKLGTAGTWVLVDGLDEATNETMRGKLVDLIEAAAGRYASARFVVTTRPAADVQVFDNHRVTIAELDDRAIGEFLAHWSRALHPDGESAVAEHRRELGQALYATPGIRRMARNPVMLTALAVVHWNENRLPEQVAELYESIATWLVKAKEKKPGREPAERVMRLMGTLALGMQGHSGGRVTQVSRATAAELLAPQFGGDLVRAREFITTEEIDSGIFITRRADLRFWHLTLQEYLSARAIAGLPDAEQYKQLIDSGVLHQSEWRQVMRLFGQVLCKQGTDKVEAFFQRMLSAVPAKAGLAEKARWVGLMGVMLGDLKAYGFALGDDATYRRMLDDVFGIFDREKAKSVPFKTRLAAAEALGQAGDPRLRLPGDKDYWVNIAAGPFVMGDVGEPSCPPREVEMKAFAIGRFPAAVAEYREFLEHNPEHKPPRDWDEQSAFGNRPVVNVTLVRRAGLLLMGRQEVGPRHPAVDGSGMGTGGTGSGGATLRMGG